MPQNAFQFYATRLSRRTVLFALAATAGGGLLAACSSGPPPTSNIGIKASAASPTADRPADPIPWPSVLPTATTPTIATTALAPTTVPEPTIAPLPSATPSPVPRTANWWTGPSSPAWLKAAQTATREHVAAHDGLTIQLSGGHDDFGRVIGGLASGQSPDLLDVGDLEPFATRGVCRDLTSYLSAAAGFSENYVPAMWANSKWQDKTYGIPALDHGPELGLFWNATLVGTNWTTNSPPTTWDDLFRLGQALTQKDGSGAITSLGFDPLDGVGGLLDTVRDVTGQDWFDSTSRAINLNNPAYQSFLNLMNAYCRAIGVDRLNSYRTDVQPLTSTNASGINEGKQASLLTGYWSSADAVALAKDHSWQFAAAWAPTLKPGDLVQRVGGRLLMIPSLAPLPDEGWSLASFLVGDDANTVFQQNTGRFAATKSFVKGETGKGDSSLQFFLDSLTGATRLTSRSNNVVAGYAQVKWQQAIADVLVGNKSVSDALSAAQTAVSAELKRVGG